MSPIEESPRPSRLFHILLSDGTELEIPALTICDKEGTGRNLILKDEDTERIVGQLFEESVVAWWITEPGSGRTRYNIKTDKRLFSIYADDFQSDPDHQGQVVFRRSGHVVGRTYKHFGTYWRETEPPTDPIG